MINDRYQTAVILPTYHSERHVPDPVGNQKDENHGASHTVEFILNLVRNEIIPDTGSDGADEQFADNQHCR